MLNQCIFIGKIKKVVSYSDDGAVLQLEIAQQSQYPKSIISVEMPKELLVSDLLRIDTVVAVKARVISHDGQTYQFTVERISVLKGDTRG